MGDKGIAVITLLAGVAMAGAWMRYWVMPNDARMTAAYSCATDRVGPGSPMEVHNAAYIECAKELDNEQ